MNITINLLFFTGSFMLQLLIISVTVTASHDSSSATSTATIPSNILFILADDLGYGDLSVFPFNRLQCSKTPHLQAMADRGE